MGESKVTAYEPYVVKYYDGSGVSNKQIGWRVAKANSGNTVKVFEKKANAVDYAKRAMTKGKHRPATFVMTKDGSEVAKIIHNNRYWLGQGRDKAALLELSGLRQTYKDFPETTTVGQKR